MRDISGRWLKVRQRFGIAAPHVAVHSHMPWYWRWVGLAVDNTAEATAAGALYSDEAGRFAVLAATFAAGSSLGLMTLVYYDGWFGRQRAKSMLGPGAASAAEFEQSWAAGLSPARWLALPTSRTAEVGG